MNKPNFTPRAYQAIYIANQSAEVLGCEHIGTEHLLIGLLRVPDSEAHKILTQLGVTEEKVRALIIND